MRARDMHPLCCITSDCPGFGLGGRSPCDSDEAPAAAPPHLDGDRPQTTSVAGILYKWTNFGKGWRPRWFVLRDGVLTYCKIRQPDVVAPPMESEGMRLIGISGGSRSAGEGLKVIGAVHLKISSFRESKSDDKRFYIITPGKTLQLRTDSAKARVAWIEALVAARSESFLNESCGINPNDMFFSTEGLRSRMRAEGLGEAFIGDCEKIIQAEFSQHFAQMRARYEDYLTFLGTYPQQMESFNLKGRTTRIDKDRLLLRKHEFSSSGHGKYSEYSNTESSEDIDQKQEVDELSEEDDLCYFDSRQSFSDCAVASPKVRNANRGELLPSLQTKRRTKLPDPIEKEKGISLWSIIKDNVGKDLTRVCLPVYFNEPLSSLQKCFEDLEYSYLLDQAYEYGKMGNSLMRILNVAAFAVSAYASSDGRLCKPFNPLLGETYEAEFPEKGLRFFSEKVSHHPMVMACHCEGRGWKFWGDSELRNKFWGQSIQLDPVGKLTLEFDDGETFEWSKVTTTIHNLIIGKVFCNHHGIMSISGNQQYSCTLKFKEHSFLDRNPRQVEGFVKDKISGAKAATLTGRWDDSIYCTVNDDASISNSCASAQQNTALLWKKSEPPENPTRYNLTSFAITLNEITPDLKEKLPPTDSRLRPDQRYLENGEYEKANGEKLRLERRQRMSRKWQENGWEPRWFRKNSEAATFGYVGGYWEARAQRKWDGCPDIFGDFSDDSNKTPSENNSKS
ncbi:oxysterol-binding protein-related protein 2B-like isoform X1 [Carex rostrata]